MNTSFKFVEKKNFWLMISITIIIIGISLMTVRFFQAKPILNFGIDFMGGNTFHLKLNNTNTENSGNIFINRDLAIFLRT